MSLPQNVLASSSRSGTKCGAYPNNVRNDRTTIRYELFMNLLLKLYGLSYPICRAIPTCRAGSGRVNENVDPFLYYDSLRGGHDLLLAVPCRTLQGMEAASAPHPPRITTVAENGDSLSAVVEIPPFVGRSAHFRNPPKHKVSRLQEAPSVMSIQEVAMFSSS